METRKKGKERKLLLEQKVQYNYWITHRNNSISKAFSSPQTMQTCFTLKEHYLQSPEMDEKPGKRSFSTARKPPGIISFVFSILRFLRSLVDMQDQDCPWNLPSNNLSVAWVSSGKTLNPGQFSFPNIPPTPHHSIPLSGPFLHFWCTPT